MNGHEGKIHFPPFLLGSSAHFPHKYFLVLTFFFFKWSPPFENTLLYQYQLWYEIRWTTKANSCTTLLPLTLWLTHLNSMLFKDTKIFVEGNRSRAVSIDLSNKPRLWTFLQERNSRHTLRKISSRVCFCLRSFNFFATCAAAISGWDCGGFW